MKKSEVIQEKILKRGAEAIGLVNEAARLKTELLRTMRALEKIADAIEVLEESYVSEIQNEDEDAEVLGSFTEGLYEENVSISDELEDVHIFTPKKEERALSRAWKYFLGGGE